MMMMMMMKNTLANAFCVHSTSIRRDLLVCIKAHAEETHTDTQLQTNKTNWSPLSPRNLLTKLAIGQEGVFSIPVLCSFVVLHRFICREIDSPQSTGELATNNSTDVQPVHPLETIIGAYTQRKPNRKMDGNLDCTGTFR
jgi:hypothetical protein